MDLKDDGTRREFTSGAVRDTAEGKGRCDLLPLPLIGILLDGCPGMLIELDKFIRGGRIEHLRVAILFAVEDLYHGCKEKAFLETAKQYEDGARKYSDRNWEKGQPTHCFVDSAVRHYLKWQRGDEDEPHDRAVMWNLLGLWWTVLNRPEMDDLPYKEGKE